MGICIDLSGRAGYAAGAKGCSAACLPSGILLVIRLANSTAICVTYGVLFSGVVLTSLGSAFYHIMPDNSRLVFDRLPMVILFMAFLSVVIAEWISERAVFWLLPLSLLAGIGSVLWWQYTEIVGHGDLRPYLLVQFYPMILIPVILVLFTTPDNRRGVSALIWIIVWYTLAKLMERFDEAIFYVTGWVSGHTLKHLAAGVATVYMVVFFKARHGGMAAGKIR